MHNIFLHKREHPQTNMVIATTPAAKICYRHFQTQFLPTCTWMHMLGFELFYRRKYKLIYDFNAANLYCLLWLGKSKVCVINCNNSKKYSKYVVTLTVNNVSVNEAIYKLCLNKERFRSEKGWMFNFCLHKTVFQSNHTNFCHDNFVVETLPFFKNTMVG